MTQPEPMVYLALSHKAAKMLDQMLEYGRQYMDGCAVEYIDDDDGDANAILDAIREDIKEQLPAPKGTKRKKGTKK